MPPPYNITQRLVRKMGPQVTNEALASDISLVLKHMIVRKGRSRNKINLLGVGGGEMRGEIFDNVCYNTKCTYM